MISVEDGAAVPLINGWVALYVKPFVPERLRDKLLPLATLALGVLYGLLVKPDAAKDWKSNFMAGFFVGLGAMGAYSGWRNATDKHNPVEVPKA